ncbi:serine/threonine-protein phosphatase 6 regulatory subunit 2 isoform X15 [Oryctolagus cuniculus]|uniref:serine/threonine-protein phosphatase 6 regulatory subunit 2 isoform X15 n=1 Tax=Oryctolagus cuniculus TaxID=9986 RepID=UPI00048DC000|nr:serine/threonine-protein phosphatase 6 regulatory subunit 2 isoform X1 [Oryctolagus cuniculus]
MKLIFQYIWSLHQERPQHSASSVAITMFWKFDLNTTSHVDKLLDKEHVTLQELMDEDDLLQECKAQNRKLLDFLCRQQCMEELVGLITQDPPLDMEEKVRFKFPNTACELLTCDVPQISDRLGEDESLLRLLCNFLDREPPLNPLLASFFSKTIGNLIVRKTEQVIAFLKKKDKFISLVLKHIGTSALMDLLLRLVSCVEPAGLRQEVLNWLNEEKIIQRLVELIHPSQDEDRQSNASQTLCDIIRLGRDQGSQLQEATEPDPLLTALESQDCVEQLLKNMFDGDHTESCLVSGTQVLLTLLETRRAGTECAVDSFSQGLERSFTVSSSVLHGLEPRLKDFHQLLLRPPKKKAILTTIGVLEEPLGNARLHGARLMAALLHTNTPSINQELCRLNTMDLLLDLFFKYTWNNFLHFQVELCVAAILSHAAAGAGGPESKEEPPRRDGNAVRDPETPQPATSLPENTMVTHLFQKCCLVQRILEAWEANDHTQAAGGMRRGNMGHLTRIANAVVQNLERGPVQTHISEVIRGLPADCRGRWESFVEETLVETNRRNTMDLVGTHHLHSSSEDEDIEGAFPNELSLQQAFSEYQIQQMTANFVDQFGFNDEEFADQDDNISAPFDRIAEINFSIDAEEDSPSAALFEACCGDRIQPFDDDEEEDIWEDQETRGATRVMARARFGAPLAADSCSKKDLEHRGRERKVDWEADGDAPAAGTASAPAPAQNKGLPLQGDSEGTAWMAVFDEPAAPGVARDVGSSVWAAGAAAPEEKGWAKFADFQPFCCSESGPRCSSPVDTNHSCAEGAKSQGQEQAFSPASPCAWNVCIPRKGPLMASDSSSSGSSGEDKQQKAIGVVEAASTGPGWETSLLPRTEAAAVGRTQCVDSRPPDPTCPAPVEITRAPAVAAPTVSSAMAVVVTTAAPAVAADLGTVTKDRETDTPPEGAALNGPV